MPFGARRVACSLVCGAAACAPGLARAEAPAQAQAPTPGAALAAPARDSVEPPSQLLLVSFSAGIPLGSAQERLLALDGYTGARYSVGLAYLGRVAEQVGVGAFGSYTTRSAGAQYGGPDLGESTGMAGGQLGWLVGSRAQRVVFVASARAGAGYGATGFHSVSAGHWGVAWGGELGLVFPNANFGAALGFMSLQVPGSGALGQSNNLGSAYGSLEIAFDG